MTLAGRPWVSTVSCSMKIVATGLNATARVMGMPFEMPPWMPPEWLVRVRTVPGVAPGSKGSLCTDPRITTPSNPEPD